MARFLFTQQTAWVARLTVVRDALVARVGIKPSKQFQHASELAPGGQILAFKIYARHSRKS